MPLMSQDGAGHQEKKRKSDNSCFLYPDFTLLYSKNFFTIATVHLGDGQFLLIFSNCYVFSALGMHYAAMSKIEEHRPFANPASGPPSSKPGLYLPLI